MASKKENKKKAEISVEKEEKFLTHEEVKARELKYLNKVMELKKCLKFIEDAQLEMNRFKEEQLLQDKWQDFISCNPLPKPYIPPDIRLFAAKLKYWENENVNNNINWLLSVNERSILSQDLFLKDLTRNKLDGVLRKNIGHEYDCYIRDSLNVLQRIDYFLSNQSEVAKCPITVLGDIETRKLAVQQEVVDLMDRFTYRIISSQNAEMNSIDALTAEYFFKGLDFDIHIWCLKNVAIRFSYMSEPRLMANFSSLHLKLHIPVEMLRENLVVRALHMKFDHLSENARSFRQVCESLNSSLLDLPNSLLNEWTTQVAMQHKRHNEMKQKCAEYEILKQQYMEQMDNEKQKSRDETDAKKKSKTRLPKEPVCLEDDMVPDVYEEFLEEERKQYENCTKNPFRPELLNLSSHEINLREYVILGGIYQVYYIQKPPHTDFNGFNMTWHRNGSKLQIEKNIKIKIDLNNVSKSQTRLSKRFTIRMSVMDIDKRSRQPDIDCPWFILTFELPEYLCYWGDPIACHFEETAAILKQPQLIETIELKHSHNKSEQISLPKPHQNIQLLGSEGSLTTSMKSVEINDFSLLEILTKPQTRNLERHILPRIISSYKFPKEVRAEDSELLSHKPKGRGGRLLRQKTHDVLQQFSNKQFTFNERQNNPERIYTTHSKVEHIRMASTLKEINLLRQEEPETFARLLQVVEDIKTKYKSSPNNIFDLKPLQQKIITQNKRIKQMLRQREQRTSSKAISKIASLSTKAAAHKPAEPDTQLKSSKWGANEVKAVGQEMQSEENDYLFPRIEDEEENVHESEIIRYSHWTTKHILKTHFDRKTRTVVIHTDRLGNFGFAFKRYEHLPFKHWTLDPSEHDPDNEVVFTLDTQYVRCVLYITADGIRGYVTEPTKTFIRHPKMYLDIKKPIADLKEFKQLFKDKFLNIFAENDAGFYIENGYFSEKHLPTELHTYNCMAVHSTQMSFYFSLWNRLAARRDIILKFRQYQDLMDNIAQVRLMPGEAYFVEIQESCSVDLNNIKLDYSLTWRNIEVN